MLTSIRTPKVKQQLYALRYAQRYAQRNVTYSHPTAALLSRPLNTQLYSYEGGGEGGGGEGVEEASVAAARAAAALDLT